MAEITATGYLSRLKTAKARIDDYVLSVDRGDSGYIEELAVKLRLLLIKKSGRPPLLKSVSDLFQLDLKVFISWDWTESEKKGGPPMPTELKEFLHGARKLIDCKLEPNNWFNQGNECIDVFEAIRRPDIVVAGKSFSIFEIVETLADKYVVHVDTTFPDDHLELHRSTFFLIGGLTQPQRLILDTSRSVSRLIALLLEVIEKESDAPPHVVRRSRV